MNKQDKIRFVKSLTDNIAQEVISKIESGRIPDNWEGAELRELLASKFQSERVGNFGTTRRRDYDNTVIVNNL